MAKAFLGPDKPELMAPYSIAGKPGGEGL